MRPLGRLLFTSAFIAVASAPLLALDAKVGEIRVAATVVRAALELKGVFRPAYRQVIEEGGTLFVRIESELWEDRPAWDRLASPARVTVFRVRRDRVARRVTVADPSGALVPYADFPDPLGVTIDVAPADRIQDDGRYYLHALTRVGNSLDLESREVGDAVFGSDEDASGLAAVGKFIFRKAQQISEYLQTVTADVTSRKLTGKQIRTIASRP
jgi:hypothetical protein